MGSVFFARFSSTPIVPKRQASETQGAEAQAWFVEAKDDEKGRKEMQPPLWQPPVALSEQEEQIVKRIRRAKLLVFLRYHRHELLDEAFQQELAGLYRASKRGQAAHCSGATGTGNHCASLHGRLR